MLSIKDSDYENVKEDLKSALDEIGGLSSFIEKNQKVLLKPNLCNPVYGSVTDPRVIRAMIELVKEITPNVYLGDLPASTEKNITFDVLQKTGIRDVLIQTKTPYINFTKTRFVVREIKDYKFFEKTDFARAFFHVDAVINMPKLKSHGITYITGAVKNLFGLVHMGERKYLHGYENEKFCHGILDIYSFLKPKIKLNVMDAISIMEGDEGPVYGPMVNCGKIMAGDDAVEMDYAAAMLTGHDPMKLLVNKYAIERGLGKKADVSITPVAFQPHSNYVKNNKLQPFIKSECAKCGSCYNICPANAIDKINDEYSINSNCIKCYCCLESCKYKAVGFQ